MPETITIPFRFRGPPNSGNGGYVAGAIAERFQPVAAPDQAIEVTLRAPIPLDTSMSIERLNADHLRMVREGTLIAEAQRTTLELTPPEPPTFAAALAARDQSPSFLQGINSLVPGGTGFHPVCACCGADTPADEGLHVYPAAVPGFAGVAAAWEPHPALAGPDGRLPAAIVWTALDCPGQFAWYVSGIRTGLLGRITARLLRPVYASRALTITGWCGAVEGKKHFAGTALHDETGELCAFTWQTWIGRHD